MEYGSPRLEAQVAIGTLIALVIGAGWTYQTYGPRRTALVIAAFGAGVLLATSGGTREAVGIGALLFLGTIVAVCGAYLARRSAGGTSAPPEDHIR